MRIQFILALLIGPVLGGFLVYKILKTYNIFPLTWQELKNRWTVEGKTLYTWAVSPPLWMRLSGFIAVIAFGTAMSFNIFYVFRTEISRIWFHLGFIVAIVLIMGVSGLKPRKYRLTDRGIWRRFESLFARTQKLTPPSTLTTRTTGKEERLIRWEEVDSVDIEKNKLIFNCQVPQPKTQKFLTLPSWKLWSVRRIAIRFNEEDTTLLQIINEYAEKMKFELNLKSVS